MLEFAIVLPILLLFLLGCIEFGWYFYNRYAVEQYAADAAAVLPDPSSYVSSRTGSPKWHSLSATSPSWMTNEEIDNWDERNDYDGWVSYDEVSSTLNSLYQTSLASVGTVLNQDGITVSLDGGWLITTMAEDLPSENQTPTEVRPDIRDLVYITRPRSEYYSLDMDVEVTYTFRPLTFLGQAIFGVGSDGTAEITTRYHTEGSVSLFLRSYI